MVLNIEESDTYNINETESLFRNLPVGFKFNPEDGDLVVHYLKRMLSNNPHPFKGFPEIKINDFTPEDVAKNCMALGNDVWYFFSKRVSKYGNSRVMNRTAGSGSWKAIGKETSVMYHGESVGGKTVLNFFNKKKEKTDWILNEFTTTIDGRTSEWTLCKMYISRNGKGNKAVQHGEAIKAEPDHQVGPPQDVDAPSSSRSTPMPMDIHNNYHLGFYYNQQQQLKVLLGINMEFAEAVNGVPVQQVGPPQDVDAPSISGSMPMMDIHNNYHLDFYYSQQQQLKDLQGINIDIGRGKKVLQFAKAVNAVPVQQVGPPQGVDAPSSSRSTPMPIMNIHNNYQQNCYYTQQQELEGLHGINMDRQPAKLENPIPIQPVGPPHGGDAPSSSRSTPMPKMDIHNNYHQDIYYTQQQALEGLQGINMEMICNVYVQEPTLSGGDMRIGNDYYKQERYQPDQRWAYNVDDQFSYESVIQALGGSFSLINGGSSSMDQPYSSDLITLEAANDFVTDPLDDLTAMIYDNADRGKL